MITAIELAKYIVSKCVNDNKPITNLQLQKILYYIQYEFLKNKGDVLFLDDIEAWQFGPVISNVYYYFCNFGSMPITIEFKDCRDIIKNLEIRCLIDSVVNEKREQNPWHMVKETHKDNGPWALTFNGGKGIRHVISVESIKKYIENGI